MTILQELAALYDRRAQDAGWPKPGFSREKIGAVVILDPDGSVREIRSLMSPDAKGKKMQARLMSVPAATKRTAGIKPNTFWDKTAYTIGITDTPDGPGRGKRTPAEHAAFKEAHLGLLDGATDPALIALRAFCETWTPERFADFPDAASLVDQNIVFRLGDGPFVHDLPTAQTLLTTSGAAKAMCLVSGQRAPVARLHPAIKGVLGAQTAGAALVSFNDAAYESHAKKQGDNAPVSEAAAFAYGTALNALLAKGSGNSVRIGNDTVAFWAEQPEAEWTIDALLTGTDDAATERELRARVVAVAEGRLRRDDVLDPEARLFVLGLAPNAARLAVRYWHPGTLQEFAKDLATFWRECSITPSPFMRDSVEIAPKPWALLYDLAARRDAKNIPDGLGGDLMRAILSGTRYPATLLSTTMARIRVEGDPDRVRHGNVDGRRAAMIRAVLMRNFKQEVPMALDNDADDTAYLLGRLFGAYAYAERSYQDRNAGLRQKYIGAASATPARVFPVLMRGYEHNLAGLRKAGGPKIGSGVKADRAVTSILALLPGGGELPATLPLEAQGRFFIGFYHQFSAFFEKPEDAAQSLIDPDDDETDNDGDKE